MRLIFYIMVAFIVYRLAKRFLVASGGSVRRGGGVAGGSRAGAGGDSGEPEVEETVLDTVCGSYLAKGLAIKVNKGGKTHYFCSEECRDKFTSGGG